MKTTLYYFSGTGNSYVVARELQKQIKDCQIAAITELWQREKIVAESENVGLVFPLYFMGLPKVVVDFLNRLDLSTVKEIFAVVTRGGKGYQGAALKQMKQMLKKRGRELNSGFYVQLPDNYIPLLTVPEKGKREKMFQKAAAKINEIAKMINSKKPFIEAEYTAVIGRLANNHFLKTVAEKDRGFYTTEVCNSCGTCEKTCHFQNVKMIEGKPQWQHDCQFCLACINYCPMQAIEYKKGTIGKERYYHPEVLVGKYIGL